MNKFIVMALGSTCLAKIDRVTFHPNIPNKIQQNFMMPFRFLEMNHEDGYFPIKNSYQPK